MKKLLAATALVLLALGAVATDFYLQARKHSQGFGGPQYVASLFDRLDGAPGYLGLMFRKSLMVSAALPDAPSGWTAHDWWSVPYDGLYSNAQAAAWDAEVDIALGGRNFVASDTDVALFEDFTDDMSRVYLGHGGAYIELFTTIEGISPNRESWAEYDRLVQAHFDKVDRISPFGTLAGATWYERRGPVETASNEGLPHSLRMFETNLGRVEVSLVTRAPEQMLRDFMEGLDLTMLRRVNDLPIEGFAVAMSTMLHDDSLRTDQAMASQAAYSGRAVVVQRGGGCSGGVFC